MTVDYRCPHCDHPYEPGGLRDCCLQAAVTEQRRLRRLIADAAAHHADAAEVARRLYARAL